MIQGTTLLKGGTIIGFDGERHRVLADGCLAFIGDRITYVGPSFAGEADEVVDMTGKLIVPGFVNTHAHAGVDPGGRMIVDAGRRDLLRSGFFNYEAARGRNGPRFWRDADVVAGIRYGLASILRFGTTTVLELGGGEGAHDDTLIELAGELGIRLYYGPTYYSGHYYFDEAGHLTLEPNEKQGFEGLERAIRFIETHHGSHEDRVRGMLIPSAFLRTPEALFARTKAAAKALDVGISFHLAESIWEFQRTVRELGRTPVQVVADWGVLGPEVILGHCVYVGGHSQTGWPHKGDLEAIATSGASVAHCPVTFTRRGMVLETFARYTDMGINMSIGTDTYPLDIFEEMRVAAVAAKLIDANFESAHARQIFNAATLGGAKALRRDDLGRLAAGAKADIVVIDMENRRMSPFNDPIRALVYCGTGDLVETVFVDGRKVVREGKLAVWDERQILEDAKRSAATVWGGFREYDYNGRRLDEVYPPCFEAWDNKMAPPAAG